MGIENIQATVHSNIDLIIVLVFSIAVERHYDQENSYRRVHLIGGLLIVCEAKSVIIMV